MHIFIDTNIFEQDPYWKNTYARTLLERAEKGKLTLYLSEIVYRELQIHTVRNFKKTRKVLNAAVIEHNKFRLKNLETAPLLDVQKEFEAFYGTLKTKHNLKILGYDKISFEKVMNRVLNHEKPFNEEKTEVKDCGIWLTYAEYVEKNHLTDCYLLTNNTKDFYDKEPLSENPTEYVIHDELKRDSKKFRCFPSIKDFLQIIVEPQIQASAKFQAWLDKTTIDNIFVTDLLKEKEGENIENKINNYFDQMEITSLYEENEWFMVGEVQVNEIEWYDCQEIEQVILEESCSVSAVLNFKVLAEGHAYNPSHDDEESKYYSLGEKEVGIDVLVSFTLKEGGRLEDFDVTDIEWRD